jgi:hypothetical protein
LAKQTTEKTPLSHSIQVLLHSRMSTKH